MTSRNCDTSEMMFLDDSENPNKFLDVIDSVNPSIMFKMEISNKQLSLLDILIEKNGDKKWTDLWFEPTDSLIFPSLISYAWFNIFFGSRFIMLYSVFASYLNFWFLLLLFSIAYSFYSSLLFFTVFCHVFVD